MKFLLGSIILIPGLIMINLSDGDTKNIWILTILLWFYGFAIIMKNGRIEEKLITILVIFIIFHPSEGLLAAFLFSFFCVFMGWTCSEILKIEN